MASITNSLALLGMTLPAGVLTAQGVTSAAIAGTVYRDGQSPIAGAIVVVMHEGTGRRWTAATAASGRWYFEDIAVGGPYRIEAKAIGFLPAVQSGIMVSLGQRLVSDLVLKSSAVQLTPISVTATSDPALDPSRTGPSEVVARGTFTRSPNPRRDYLDLTLSSPQVALSPASIFARPGGITVAGQNRMYNSFQIDGGLNHDLYRGALPGRETLPRPISLEAVEEIQMHPAPFDVRYGGFTGGVMNAVTRSGTNALHGSVFGYMTDGGLVGRDVSGEAADDFSSWQFGASLAGPIKKDRIHFFLSVDLQRRTVPDPGPLISDTTGGADTTLIGIRYESATRFQDIMRESYGLDAGTLGPLTGREPAEDLFGKVSAQLGTNSHLEASYHYSNGHRVGLVNRTYGLYAMSTVAQTNPSRAHTARLIWSVAPRAGWSNEVIVSYLRLRDHCLQTATYPRINVFVDQGMLSAGPAARCPTDSFGQDILEATDNLTVGLGSHLVTVGAHGRWLKFSDEVLTNSPGMWRFRSLELFQSGRGFAYQRAFYGPDGGAGANFRVRELGLYAQDRWTPNRDLTVTAGLRVDVTALPDRIPTNTALLDGLGIDTGEMPSGQMQWQPRLGMNYDMGGRGQTFFRAGIGLFAGPPPYMWVGSAYHDSGGELLLTCGGVLVPQFDPVNQPDTCAGGAGAAPQLSYFAPGTRFPRVLKLGAGTDHRLPWDVVGTLDLLYTRAVDQFYLDDANMGPPVTHAAGEGEREVYGTFNEASGSATTTARKAPGLRAVLGMSNRSGDEALSLAVQLRKRFRPGIEGGVLYAYSRSRDRLSLMTFNARGNMDFVPLDGPLADRRVTTSAFEIPHRVQAYLIAPLPAGFSLSARYQGASGTAFTYTIDGDANADGFGGAQTNDVVYVPAQAEPGGDVRLVQTNALGQVVPASAAEYDRLEAFIEEEPCLRTHRGRLLARNSCRNPWFGTLDLRLSKAIATGQGKALELTAFLYNALSMIDKDWGLYRTTQTNATAVTMMRLVGYNDVAGRGVYQLALPARNEAEDLLSRWQLELGVRYVF